MCGSKNTLFHTFDGGKTWQPNSSISQTIVSNNRLISIATVLQYNVIVLAQQPDLLLPTQVFYSLRNGYDFMPGITGGVASANFAHMGFRTYKLGLLVGEGGALRISRSQGSSWDQLPSGTQNNLWGSDSPDGDTYFLVGSKGTLRKGTLLGGTSKALNSNTFARLTGVWFVDLQQGYIIGDGGTALRTTDGGTSWQPMAINTSVNLNAVRFLDAKTGFIVGDLGTLLLTTDGGKTWKPEASNTYETLTAISATDDGLNVWVVGGNGTVLKRGAVLPLASRGGASLPAWQAYPNPFTTSLTLTGLGTASSLPTEVALFDQLGRLALSQLVTTTVSREYSLTIPSSLAAGVYTLRVTLPGQPPTTRQLIRLP
jgi:hypothetical protein